MKTLDTTYMSAHFIVDRKTRIEIIEKTVGFGKPVYEAPNKYATTKTDILTDTGVYVVVAEDGMIVTAWIADVRQAELLYKRATGKKFLPSYLWAVVNYNNNTKEWHRMAA